MPFGVVRDCHILEPKLQAGQLVCVTPTFDGPRTGHQVMKDLAFIPVCWCLCAVFLPFYSRSFPPLRMKCVDTYIMTCTKCWTWSFFLVFLVHGTF